MILRHPRNYVDQGGLIGIANGLPDGIRSFVFVVNRNYYCAETQHYENYWILYIQSSDFVLINTMQLEYDGLDDIGICDMLRVDGQDFRFLIRLDVRHVS